MQKLAQSIMNEDWEARLAAAMSAQFQAFEEKLNEYKVELKEELNDFKVELNEYKQKVDILTKEMKDVKDEIAALRVEVIHLKAQNADLNGQNADLVTRVGLLEVSMGAVRDVGVALGRTLEGVGAAIPNVAPAAPPAEAGNRNLANAVGEAARDLATAIDGAAQAFGGGENNV
jgi:septal ring factor EnvC (AmiA/AmiB activator)